MIQLLALLGAFLLVALNGFFVAAEFGLVKLRTTRVQSLAEQHGVRGRLLAKVHGQLDAYLSACQLGITLASLGLGWIGEPAFAQLLAPVFEIVGVQSAALVHGISLVFAFTVISFLHIVVGELAPKSLAIREAEKISLWAATPLYAFYWAMYPAIWVLNSSASAVLRIAGLSSEHGHDTHYSTDELKLILRTRRAAAKAEAEAHDPQHGARAALPPPALAASAYNADEWNTLAHSLDFSRLTISDLMRPTHEMVGLRRDVSLRENMQIVKRHRFSRYPLFEDGSGERVAGLIHLKDLLLARESGHALDDLGKFVRPVQYVRPDTPALALFRRFRKGAPHFALVGHKGARPIGFLTLDNLLGALVGQIHDEFHQADTDWTRMDDGTLMGRGSLPVVSLEQALGIDIDEGRAESVGGLVIHALNDLPTEGQRVSFDRFDIVVKKMKGPRIVLVRIYPKDLEDEGG
ncbi:hemolysin family protein [Paraburkholderia unamae]|uniref:CBS domain containing-hemolysin-like protein n=1 Tax=Paraburkholderia unamae TaxID=219649 RepID=A0ABX5KXT9_9BURK|nr:hemolysin family protein [Paraburkholderia unamae]PVX86202.1 CBS domain containing-hemolysin-like protein [Paraburkholderia unamae]RAR68250.1 CBS domain containing-hemolysin-like protein [Paraburkholderia unamae]CAG9244549.1 Magnesium and cobalt efflux protein CorC [Paraburkholderia unamae]